MVVAGGDVVGGGGGGGVVVVVVVPVELLSCWSFTCPIPRPIPPVRKCVTKSLDAIPLVVAVSPSR